MQSLIPLLSSVSAGTVLGWTVAIVVAAVSIYQWAQKYRNARNQYEQTKQEAKQNSQAIKSLQKTNQDNYTVCKQHFDALEQRDTEIVQQIHNITGAIEGVKSSQRELMAYQKSKDVADLKDRIEHAYKTYMQRGKINGGSVFITQNQEEILKSLIKVYEDAGGDSFIHTKIKPALAEWEVIDQKQFMKRMNGAAHD